MGVEELKWATQEQSNKFTALKESLDVHDAAKDVVDEDDMRELERQWVVLSEKLTSTSEEVGTMIKDLRGKMAAFVVDNWDVTDPSFTLANGLIKEMETFQQNISNLQVWAKTHITSAYEVSTIKEWAGPATTTVAGAIGNDNFVAGASVSEGGTDRRVQATFATGSHQVQVTATTNKETRDVSTEVVMRWGNRNLMSRTGMEPQPTRPLQPLPPEVPQDDSMPTGEVADETNQHENDPLKESKMNLDQNRPKSPDANAG